MSFSVVVLIARIGLVALLYLFLLWVVRAALRDLRTAGAANAAAAPRPAAPGIPQLVVLAPGNTPYQVGQQFRLRGPTLLGRDPGAEIPVEDDWVSGQHLRLLPDGAGWAAQDLTSTNGTRINGTRLRGTVPLKQGDVLDLGRLRLRFTEGR